MTDRELLEQAAKAAGIEIDPIDAAHEPSEWQCWNPLTDDGDALRLAVKLGFTVEIGDGYVDVLTWTTAGVTAGTESDPYAATRRAIVRAAAEIGRSMA